MAALHCSLQMKRSEYRMLLRQTHTIQMMYSMSVICLLCQIRSTSMGNKKNEMKWFELKCDTSNTNAAHLKINLIAVLVFVAHITLLCKHPIYRFYCQYIRFQCYIHCSSAISTANRKLREKCNDDHNKTIGENRNRTDCIAMIEARKLMHNWFLNGINSIWNAWSCEA